MTVIKLKGGFRTSDPRLDRIPEVDPRNAEYPISAVVPEDVKRKTWRLTQRLDQGQEGACVGFGFAHEIAADPARGRADEGLARRIYHEAQLVDEWLGEAYSGTSVLAGAKITQGMGFIGEYRWAFTLNEVLRAVSHEGPVVMGTRWYDSMYSTDAKGLLKVGGSLVGGHCWLLRGVDPSRELVTARNSWGRDWGRGGDFFMSFADLERLISEGGDACVPTNRRSKP